jgi:integrase
MANIQRRPDGRWRARYRDASGREHAKHFTRKIDAQWWVDGVTSAMVTGTYVDPAKSRITVGQWSARWLDAQLQLKPSTHARYESILRCHVLPTWASVPLAAVTHADVTVWVARLSSEALAPASVRQAHRVLSLVLSLAVRDGRIPRNPADKVSLPRARKAEKRFLSHSEVEALAEAAGDHRLAIRVLASCGLRFGELAALRIGRVDLMRRRLEITESVTEVKGKAVFGTTKTHATRSVPVRATLVDALTNHVAGRAREELVFCAPRGGWCCCVTGGGRSSTRQPGRLASTGSPLMSSGTQRQAWR